jgi:integrase
MPFEIEFCKPAERDLAALAGSRPGGILAASDGGRHGEAESLPSRGQSEWIFPSRRARSGHLEEPKKAWQRIRERAAARDVRIHDLRRTLGSWLAASGYGLPMIGRVLNHSQPSATAVYARLDLEPVRRALEANAQAMLGAERSAEAGAPRDVAGVD